MLAWIEGCGGLRQLLVGLASVVAVGADTAWVVQLVEVGILRIETAEAPPERWEFSSTDLQCALEARRLERDFGVNLDAAALILDLQREVRRLKAALHAHGLR